MRLSDLFRLVQDLFEGGHAAAEQRIRQINQSNAPHQKITLHMLWHIWAILGMFAINYLLIVHLPQWTKIWNQQIKSTSTEVVAIQWSPEVWQSKGNAKIYSRYNEQNPIVQAKVDVEAVPINLYKIRRSIEIPAHLKTLNTTTRVKLRVLVDEKGNYVQHRLPQHRYPDLADAVDAKASELSFLPALRNAKPVPYWVEVRFVFEL